MIKLIKSAFLEEEKTKKELANFILKTEQLSFGPQCEKFEETFAEWQGRKECVFVNSGSSANLAIVQALLNLGKLKKGDMVGFSALTWSTNVMPLIELGLIPVPIDIELDTLNISSKKLIERISEFPLKGLFLTNLLGFCDDIDVIKDFCAEKGIIFFEDNCESIGTIYRGNKLGNFGIASTFSFFVGHHLSTIEGGAVCTDDAALAQMLRLVRAHGWDRNLKSEDQVRLRKEGAVDSFYGKYTFYHLGYNLRPTEIAGFLGNSQLPYMDIIISRRQEIFNKVARVAYQSGKYYAIRSDHLDTISNFAVPFICRNEEMRRELVKKVSNQVEVRPIVGGDITEQPFWRYTPDSVRAIKSPNAELVHQNGFYAPNNPELTEGEIKTITNVFS